jgi:hypothetical protein
MIAHLGEPGDRPSPIDFDVSHISTMERPTNPALIDPTWWSMRPAELTAAYRPYCSLVTDELGTRQSRSDAVCQSSIPDQPSPWQVATHS